MFEFKEYLQSASTICPVDNTINTFIGGNLDFSKTNQ